MKILDTDAVRKLYRSMYFPGERQPVMLDEMRLLSNRSAATFAALQALLSPEERALLSAVTEDMDRLSALDSEDAFVKGFTAAAELLLSGGADCIRETAL